MTKILLNIHKTACAALNTEDDTESWYTICTSNKFFPSMFDAIEYLKTEYSNEVEVQDMFRDLPDNKAEKVGYVFNYKDDEGQYSDWISFYELKQTIPQLPSDIAEQTKWRISND